MPRRGVVLISSVKYIKIAHRPAFKHAHGILLHPSKSDIRFGEQSALKRKFEFDEKCDEGFRATHSVD